MGVPCVCVSILRVDGSLCLSKQYFVAVHVNPFKKSAKFSLECSLNRKFYLNEPKAIVVQNTSIF